jgi:hypothetical protein
MQITRLLLFFAFLLLSGKIFAQGTVDARSFPDSNFSWNETYEESNTEFEIFNYYKITYYDAGDTIVQNIHYRKLNLIKVYFDLDRGNNWPTPYVVRIENSNELFGLLRNDKQNKKVYLIDPNSNEEYVLFDFGLKLKDKITMNYFPAFAFIDYYIIRVDSIIDPNGVTRKFFKYSENLADTNQNSNDQCLTIIEGIGMSNGIYTRKVYIPFEHEYIYMKCIKLGNNRIFKINTTGWSTHSSTVSIDTLASCEFTQFQYLGVENTKTKSITIYPNPADNIIHFNIDNEIEILEIFDSKLTLVKSSTQLRNKFLDISQFPSGIYFCKIYSKGNYYSGKFLKN